MISWIWLLQTFKQTPFAQLLPPKKLFVHFPKVTWLWMWTGCNISGERWQDGGDDDDDGDDDGDDGGDGDDGDRNVAMLVIVESRVLTFDSCETVDV